MEVVLLISARVASLLGRLHFILFYSEARYPRSGTTPDPQSWPLSGTDSQLVPVNLLDKECR